jgi:hypothetical protein
MTKPLLYFTDPIYFKKIIEYHGFKIINNNKSAKQFFIAEFGEYNHLLDMNHCFSKAPVGDIVDRTQTVDSPFNFYLERPWKPAEDFGMSFDDCMTSRVQELIATKQKLNLFWSGGIDSTATVVAFLSTLDNYDQIRIVYTPVSLQENPNFYLQLVKIPNLELYDYSGDVYLKPLDGLYVTGDGSDEITGSLDESFYNEYGYAGLQKSWEDLFYKYNPNSEFIEWARVYFKNSGRDINTIWEARWFFYIAAKMQYYISKSNALTEEGSPLSIGFFNHVNFDHYMSVYVNSLIGKTFNTYKQIYKNYIFKYDKNERYCVRKTKVNSTQTTMYRNKKLIVLDRRFIARLSDNTCIRTDNLPLLSEKEYRNKYGNSLDYLFNYPY